MRRIVLTMCALLLAVSLVAAPAAFAHGDAVTAPGTAERKARDQAIREGKSAGEAEQKAAEAAEAAEVATLVQQPARVLAQQAHALIHIRGDRHEAGVRLEAAVRSEDRREVDEPTLRRARDLLESGGPAAQVLTLIDEALSKPLGAKTGKIFHGAGREFEPAKGGQELVAIVAGSVLLLLGIGLLARRRSPRAAG